MQKFKLATFAIASLLIGVAASDVALSQSQSPNKAPAANGATPFKSEQDKALYALGVLLSRNLQSFALTPDEQKMVSNGFVDGARGRPLVANAESLVPQIQQIEQTRRMAVAAGEKKRGAEYLTTAAAAKGATKTASGIVMTTLKAGTGPSPKATSTVKVHYEGKLIDGRVFDSSIKRGEPASFPLSGVIRCWTEAVQLMKVGGKSRLVCPSNLAYGDGGSPPNIPGGATLIFDVELLAIEQM